MAQDPSRHRPLIDLPKAHVDARGAIQPLVQQAMGSAVLISSRKGTVRANHYHRADWHYCYVLEGWLEYLYRPAGDTAEPRRILVAKGEMVFTPPLVEHAMRFLEDTVFLTLGGGHRDQASYEADVVRVALVEA